MKAKKEGKKGYLVYKCRNCNEVFNTGLTDYIDEVFFNRSVCRNHSDILVIHVCSEHSKGLADLIGMNYEETNENIK